MPSRRLFLALACLILSVAAAPGQVAPTEWTVDGEKRQAVVIVPAQKGDKPAPLVLVFHGHGGTMRASERLGYQKKWPEAIVVCPQGLPTVTPLDPKGTRAGWQHKSGDDKDRDLKFVDAILKTVREQHKVDDARVYATGHSNGGVFTYLLWEARGKEFAALAPTAAVGRWLATPGEVKPLPVLHVAGEKDATVPIAGQRRTAEAARKLNGCDAEGKPWGKAGSLVATVYASKGGTPFVWAAHPGGHMNPSEVPDLVVKFFQEHAKK